MLTKPQGSLGRLEGLSVQLAGIARRCPPPRPARKAVIVFAGDHGVVAQGVSAYPQEVTPQMVLNFLRGGAAINVLARQAGAYVVVVDAGVAVPLAANDGLILGKIAPGTADMSAGPAMTRAEAEAAVALGLRVTQGLLDEGLDLLACGKVGGFEIGAIAGAMLAAAARAIPVVVDGFIATSAAIIAAALAPGARAYMIAGHRSAEPGHDAALAYLGLTPLLDLSLIHICRCRRIERS